MASESESGPESEPDVEDGGGGNRPESAVDPSLPGVPLTRRARAKSAVLWGAVGALAFLVVAQGYLLVGGELPVRYVRLFPIAAVIGVVAAAITYLAEHRLRAKRRV